MRAAAMAAFVGGTDVEHLLGDTAAFPAVFFQKTAEALNVYLVVGQPEDETRDKVRLPR